MMNPGELSDWLDKELLSEYDKALRDDQPGIGTWRNPCCVKWNFIEGCKEHGPEKTELRGLVGTMEGIRIVDNVDNVHLIFNSERPENYQQKAKRLVQQYFNERVDKSDGLAIEVDDVYVVWFSKTLQNWKCMLSTNVTDGMYYEVTYNGDKRETYLDAYKKFENQCIKDEGILF